jgi:cobalt/nickel transport system permease protein
MNYLIDSLAYTNRLRWLPPSHKLSFAMVLLLFSLVSSPLVQVLISLWLIVWIVVYAGIPAKIYLGLLLLPIGFWFTSVPAFVINVTNVKAIAASAPLLAIAASAPLLAIATVQSDLWQNWGINLGNYYLYISQSGLHQIAWLLTRILATTSSMYFILLTTPFTEVVQFLRKLGFPSLLSELLLLMYRFIFTLLAIASELWLAQNSRCGYRTWRRGMYSLGILIGQLLQRSFESYRQVSLSLASRGFNGELKFWHSSPYQPSRRYIFESIFGCVILIILCLNTY